MRLLFIDLVGWDYDPETPLHEPLGGTQSATAYLTAELARQGVSVTLLNDAARPRTVAGVEIAPRARLSTDFLNAFDVIVVVSGALGEQLARQFSPRPPLVLWCHHAADQPAVQRLKLETERAAWSAYVTVSHWQRDGYIKAFGIPAHRALTIGNAVSPAFLDRPADEPWFVSGAPPVLTYTSTPFRGLETLLIAFPSIRERIPDVRLEVYSSMKLYRVAEGGDDFRPLYALAKALPGVDYIGPLPQADLARALSGAAALAYPCLFAETSCIAAMEAMAAGLEVLTTEHGALPETLAGFGAVIPLPQSGMRLAATFARLVADTLERMRADPAAALARRNEQMAHVRENYTWTARAKGWIKLADVLASER